MRIIRVSQTASTNSFLKELHREQSFKESVCVIAEQQTAGRGQKGNVWLTEPFQNLTFSVLLPDILIPLEKQYQLAEKTNLTTKAGRALKKEILLLERELEIIQSKSKKKETEGQKEILKLIGAREKKLKDLVGQESKAAELKRNAIKSQAITLQMLHQQAGIGGGLTGMMKEQLQVTDSLGSGMNDISGIQTLQVQSSDRLNEINEERLGLLGQRKGLRGELSDSDKADIAAKLKQLRIEKNIEGQVGKNLEVELKSLSSLDMFSSSSAENMYDARTASSTYVMS